MPDPFAEIKYRKSFLKQVIARVDLLSPLTGVNEALPTPIAEVAVRTFPIPEPREAIHKQFKIDPKGVTSSEERLKEWNFHDKDRTKTLTIGQQVILIQHTAYETYELVRAEFSEILGQIATVFQGVQTSRVGLRYINNVQLSEQNPTDWSAYVAPQLLSVFEFPPEEDRPSLSRVFHDLELSLDAFNLHCRFGMHNPDYPARIRQKVFILDLDAYSQTSMGLTDVGRLLDELHGTIQRYFEQSITDRLREIMNAA